MGHTLSDALLTPPTTSTTTTPTTATTHSTTTATDTSRVTKEGEKEVVNTPTHIQPFHFDTIQYLNGILLTICLECLYSKDTNSNYIHANTIKNILSIDPTLGHIVLPFLINALTTVNQSHQTPIALYTLNLTFKTLLYPMPIILYYIPSLLQYTLPGIDPADQMKTVLTLSYISTILSWIPTMSTYTINTNNNSSSSSNNSSSMSYLTLLKRLIVTQVDSSTPDLASASDLTHLTSPQVTQSYYDTLASYLPQYFDLFLDKIFLLLQAQEGTQSSNNTNTSSNNSSGNGNKGHNSGAMPSICECIGYIFQGINSIKIREQVEDKVLLYFKNNTLINSVKTCAKILEYMVSIAVY